MCETRIYSGTTDSDAVPRLLGPAVPAPVCTSRAGNWAFCLEEHSHEMGPINIRIDILSAGPRS